MLSHEQSVCRGHDVMCDVTFMHACESAELYLSPSEV